jgi:protein SCO1/2
MPAHQLEDRSATSASQKRGQPVLVGMFYTSCEFVCPMLVEALRNTEAGLTAQERAKFSVLLITIDPGVTRWPCSSTPPAAWDRFAPLDLARSDVATTRKLAAVLGLQYRALPNGDFNHSTDLILLDADGGGCA